MHQKVKHEQPMAQEGHPQGAPNVTESTIYQPHTQVEFVDLGKQFQQKQRGTLGRLTFATLGHRVDLVPLGVFQVLTERSRETACEMPAGKCEDPDGVLSWQGSHLG